jgi:hypothetical protein
VHERAAALLGDEAASMRMSAALAPQAVDREPKLAEAAKKLLNSRLGTATARGRLW